jgi:phenylalanine-4-hydroxylase
MEKKRPTEQVYGMYTAQDFAVWRTLFERQMVLLEKYGSRHFLDALKQTGFCAGEIPRFSRLNQRLQRLTGWQVSVVPGLVPAVEFFELLSQRIFPATCWLRQPEQIDYIEEPDMFHDVFGHVPLLCNRDFAGFLEAFGTLGVACCDDPERTALLSTLYWFSVEFGLIREGGETKVWGAGIVSSPGEVSHAVHPNSKRLDFRVEEVVQTSYRTDQLQQCYFEIREMADLGRMLTEVRDLLPKMAGVI